MRIPSQGRVTTYSKLLANRKARLDTPGFQRRGIDYNLRARFGGPRIFESTRISHRESGVCPDVVPGRKRLVRSYLGSVAKQRTDFVSRLQGDRHYQTLLNGRCTRLGGSRGVRGARAGLRVTKSVPHPLCLATLTAQWAWRLTSHQPPEFTVRRTRLGHVGNRWHWPCLGTGNTNVDSGVDKETSRSTPSASRAPIPL